MKKDIVSVLDDLQDLILCELNILEPIKIGRRYIFSYASLVEFERKFRGLDLSNSYKALEAKKIVDSMNSMA